MVMMTQTKKDAFTPSTAWLLNIGDKIAFGEYTATCQRKTLDAEYGLIFATFWLDQPILDGTFTHRGDVNATVDRVCKHSQDFKDLLMQCAAYDLHFELPTVEDIFGWDGFYQCSDEDGEQWPLMKIVRNRLPDMDFGKEPEDKFRSTWLLNETTLDDSDYATISWDGMPSFDDAGANLYVRPKFTIALPMPGEEPNEF